MVLLSLSSFFPSLAQCLFFPELICQDLNLSLPSVLFLPSRTSARTVGAPSVKPARRTSCPSRPASTPSVCATPATSGSSSSIPAAPCREGLAQRAPTEVGAEGVSGAVRGNAKTLVRALWRSDGKQLLGVWNLLLLNQQPEPFPVPKSARAVENCIGNVPWSSPKVCLSSLGTLGAPAQTGAVVCASQECPHPHMCGVGVCAAEQRLPTTQQERWYFSRLAALEIPSPLFPLPWAGWLILGAPR